MLEGVEETSKWTTAKIKAIRALMDDTIRYVRGKSPKLPHALLELIFTQPYTRIADLVQRGIAKRQAASTYLRELVNIGVLLEEKAGREKIFLHRKYLDVVFCDGHSFEPYERAVNLSKDRRKLRGSKPSKSVA